MKSRRKKWLVIAGVVLLPLWVCSGPPIYSAEEMRGQVVDAETGAPIIRGVLEMIYTTVLRLPLSVLIVVGGISGAHAGIYKCKDASGAFIYQQLPCTGAAHEKKLDDSSAPAAQAGPDAEAVNKWAVFLTLGFKRYCDNTMPGFAEQVAFEWSRWRDKNLMAIREIEADPKSMEKLTQQPDQMANFKREDARFVCTPQWVRDLVGDSRSNLLQFASSPESTWRHFIEALARADRGEALNCYSMASRPKFGRVLESLSDDQLRNQAATWKLVGPPTGDSSSREYFIQAGTKHAGTVWFYLLNGNWLIAEM